MRQTGKVKAEDALQKVEPKNACDWGLGLFSA